MIAESCHQCRKDERAGNGRWLRMRREGEVPGATPQLPSIIGPPAPGCARAGQCASETAKVVCTGSDLLKCNLSGCDNLHGRCSSLRGSVAELTTLVLAPAPCRTTGGDGARVRLSRCDSSESLVGRHGHRCVARG